MSDGEDTEIVFSVCHSIETPFSLTEGSEVEISYEKESFKKVWYSAIVEGNPATNPEAGRELCVRLLKDDFSTPLTQLTDSASFRPIPPENLQAKTNIVEGTIVDAHHKDGWWTGLVVKENEDDKCLVFFESPPDIIQFQRKHLRPHLTWIEEIWWEEPFQNVEANLPLLRRLTKECVFSSGTMVEVSSPSEIYEGDVVWIPAMIVKEIKEDDNDEKKYMVKLCDNPLSYEDKWARPNKTVDFHTVRPRPPPLSVDEYQSMKFVEVFHGTSWCQGQVTEMIDHDWCEVLIEASNTELRFKLSDIRPSRVWEDGVWKPREPPLTEALVNEIGDYVMNANESGPHVTPSPGITTTPLKETEGEIQRKTFPNNTLQGDQNGSENDSTRENETRKDNNRKRKRDLSSGATVEENEANDNRIVLSFEKKLPIWKTIESMEAFQTIPQNPHFIPLVGTGEDSREMSAVVMMLTFSGLLKEVKDLQPDDPISSLNSLNDAFAELKKHGFDVKVLEARISKLLSLRDRQAKKIEELKVAKKKTAEKVSLKVENERKR